MALLKQCLAQTKAGLGPPQPRLVVTYFVGCGLRIYTLTDFFRMLLNVTCLSGTNWLGVGNILFETSFFGTNFLREFFYRTSFVGTICFGTAFSEHSSFVLLPSEHPSWETFVWELVSLPSSAPTWQIQLNFIWNWAYKCSFHPPTHPSHTYHLGKYQIKKWSWKYQI